MRHRVLGSVVIAVLATAVVIGCAHRRPIGGLETLRTAAERFHLLLRWGDLRGAAQFVVPERRLKVLKAILDAKDEDNLKVMEYELEDAQLTGDTAAVLSKVTWMRLPSVTVKSETMTTSWVYRDGTWFIDAIDGGPIPLPREGADGGR